MLNLNLSLLTLTFFIFLLVSYYFVFFKYSMISFVVALSSFPKADAKVVQLLLPTKFFNHFFSKKIHFFCNYPNYQANIFSLFFELFGPFLARIQFSGFLLFEFKSDSEARWSISTANYFKFSDF